MMIVLGAQQLSHLCPQAADRIERAQSAAIESARHAPPRITRLLIGSTGCPNNCDNF